MTETFDYNYRIIVCPMCKLPQIVLIETELDLIFGPVRGIAGGKHECSNCGYSIILESSELAT